MHMLKVGVHYETAPVDIREKIVFQDHIQGDAMVQLQSYPTIEESVILSTCNRTELYVSTSDATAGFRAMEQFIADWFQIEHAEFQPFLHYTSDEDTMMHLLRLTTGIDSLVIGETQILGQVKHAFHLAQQQQTTNKLFNELFKRVITFARRAHKDTAIGEQAMSVSYVAVELAKKMFGNLHDQHVLILGAGETGALTLKHLQSAGVRQITIANRTFDRAIQLAEKFQVGAIEMNHISGMLQDVDVVISATASPNHILTKDIVQACQKQRKGHPLFLIDIAVPRDMDPTISELDDVFLYDIDDFEAIVQRNMKTKQEAARTIEARLAPEIAAFNNWLAMLDAVPVIKALTEKSHHIQEQTLKSIQRKMPDLSEREVKVLQKHTKSIIHQLLEEPIKQAKTMGESAEDLRKFQDIFGLEKEL